MWPSSGLQSGRTLVAFSWNRSKNERKYLIGDAIWPGFVPKDQEEYFKDTLNHSPRMQVDWFLKSRLLAVKSAVDTIASRHGTKRDHDAENHPADAQEAENHETDALPMQAQHVSGIKLIDIDTDREWTNIVAQHVMKCGSLFKFVKSEKKGFKLMDFYQCMHCHVTLYKHACFSSHESVLQPPEKRGPKTAELNALMGVAAYCSGVTPARLEEMCANAGIVCPSQSNLMIMYERVKDSVLDLSGQALRYNHRKHNAACRSQTGYKGDIKFQDHNRKWHSFARGAIAIDGGGGKRAYQHCISGSTHCLIIFSLVTSEPLYVQVDQISCQRCSIAMLKVLRETGK